MVIKQLAISKLELVVVKHIRLVIVKQLKLVMVKQLRQIIKQLVKLQLIKLIRQVNEQPIFRLDNIQLFLNIYQQGRILKYG